MNKKLIMGMFVALFAVSCAHPMYEAKEKALPCVSRVYNTNANEAYNAIRWALKSTGYSITSEDLQNGVVMSGWLPSKSDTFYVAPFGHKDYGVNGAYYKFEVLIVPEDGKTRVDVIPHVKSMASRLHSSGIAEKKLLGKVADYLRSPDAKVTNLGLDE